ncbi:hypothetical protein LOTGIDRAFT_176997 [Lottia gigantea]|uniref:Uncharacterized protein n=1 Tax=Lottia gigantea TaxID=225164 RepID=V4CPU8_LOTGI|nr:hypothetical protein LOTGIDRAFT_176997 [Lottia gigantea]ESP04445.1 hypothetical protein LOTGIDRAFT_176997 [Lottia gigantea]
MFDVPQDIPLPPQPKPRKRKASVSIASRESEESDEEGEVVIVERNDVHDSSASPAMIDPPDDLDDGSDSSSSLVLDEQLPQRSSRVRRPPQRYQDYVMSQSVTTKTCPPSVLALILSDEFLELPLDRRKSISQFLKKEFEF